MGLRNYIFDLQFDILEIHFFVQTKMQQSGKSRKRSREDQYIIDDSWVSASSCRNYLLKDPLLDWLNYHASSIALKYNDYSGKIMKALQEGNPGQTLISNSVPREPTQFTEYIKQRGNKFEEHLVKYLYQKLGAHNIRDIGGTHLNCPSSPTKFRETVDAIKEGVPIIYSGVLHDPEEKIYGVPDLIVRSDWLKKLVVLAPLTREEEKIPAPALNGNYHYRILDIKLSTLPLCTDGIHLRNAGSIPAYKGQVYIYNQMLAKIQGYDPGVAYLLGRKWKTPELRGNSCLDRLGVIDFRPEHQIQVDKEIVIKTREAIKWLREMKEGENWDLNQIPLPREELYPNMSNRSDYPWRSVKKHMANKIDEITCLWQVGPKKRKLAHSKGIYRWTDPLCTPEALGIKDGEIARVLTAILDINRDPNAPLIRPAKIRNNYGNWQNRRKLEFYVDFEAVSDLIDNFENLPESLSDALIILIGVGYTDPDTKEWHYTHFMVNELTLEEEDRICREFITYVQQAIQKHDCKPHLIHWSNAERIMWEAASKRHPENKDFSEISEYWFDLLKVFGAEPIVTKGCLSFGLKEVAKTWYKHKLIQSSWNSDSPCQSGSNVVSIAYRAAKECKESNDSMQNHPLIKEMIKYNEIDCKVLSEIIDYLRENHVKHKRVRINKRLALAKQKPKVGITKASLRPRIR